MHIRCEHALAALATILIATALDGPARASAEAGGAAMQDAGPPDEQSATLVEELGRALEMTPAEVEALGLSPAEMRSLLAGFTEETVVVGSRAEPRSATESAVPVDVLTVADLGRQGGGDLKDQLRTVIPSFNVNTQPIGGASTVVRPAMLRNLAPDHTLILVNGKRRHRASIIDWHGGNGVAYGSQAPDISTIPSIALRQVEVLRDGAAAQYGSDAIAGVMNFQLKDAASGGSLQLDTGMFGAGDGETWRLAGNVGLPLGPGGFANLSLQAGASNPTTARRPAATRSRSSPPATPTSSPRRRRSGARRTSTTTWPSSETSATPCPPAWSSTPTPTTPARRSPAASSSATRTCSAASTATTTAARC